MQITEHVHAIKIPFQVKTDSGTLERFVYAYLICGEKVFLVDSGVSSSEKIILDYLEKIGHRASEISLLILTHSHPDHVGSASSIQRRSGCEIAAHLNEKSWIEDVGLQFKERPVPNFHSMVEGPVQLDHVLKDGDIIDMGRNLNVEIIHTPGHSAGSISLYIQGDSVLITGDAVPLRGDLPIYDDFAESVRSIEKLKSIKDLNVLLASWDHPQEDNKAYQRMDEALNYLQHIQEVVDMLSPDNYPPNLIEFSKLVLKELGLPEAALNPIVVRSFQANLKNNTNRI